MHGMHVAGFPNLFVVGFSQAAALISNIPHNLVEAGQTVAAIVRHAEDNEFEVVEVPQEVEDAWLDKIALGSLTSDPDCTPGYYNNEGQPDEQGLLGGGRYPDGPMAFFAYIDRWRTSGEFDGLEFR